MSERTLFALILCSLVLFSLGLVAAAVESEHEQPSSSPSPEVVLTGPGEAAEGEGLSLEIWLDKRAYEPGERLEVHFRITKDCYVYIYDISTEGKVTLLFPNAFQPENFLSAGRYSIPDRRYSLVVAGSPGLEYLQAIASTKPIQSLVLPEGASEKAPFPPIEAEPVELKHDLERVVQGLSPGEWAAAWTSFYLLEPGRAWLIVTSEPSGAKVYLNGRAVGVTPLATSVKPGFVRVVLEKKGYQSWAKRLYLERSEVEELAAQLEEATGLPPLSPPEPGGGSGEFRLPGLGLGLNLGLDWGSLGMEVRLLPQLWLGTAARFTGERVPEYYEVEPPEEPWPDERVYNSGPEMEFYSRLTLPLRKGLALALTLGGGLAVQERVHLAMPPSEGPLPQDITIKPNGYRTSENHFTALGGLVFKWEELFLELGYHSRRGLLIGGGIEF
ncbi:MAG: DUF4384 domain-containing protein [Candidatus Bipolaricaulia bacterium]